MAVLFIFIRRKEALGDVIWVEPCTRSLLKHCLFIFFQTNYALLVRKHFSMRIISFAKSNRILNYLFAKEFVVKPFFQFLNLDKAYEQDPQKHILEAYLNKCGILKQELSYPVLRLSKNSLDKEKTVIIHRQAPSSKLSYRKIADIKWGEITEYLNMRGFKVLELVDKIPDETNEFNGFILSKLSDVVKNIKMAMIFIGLDSGPSHIATSLGIPSIIFFGSVNPQYRQLEGLFTGEIIVNHCKYSGCYHYFMNDHERKCTLEPQSDVAPCCKYSTEQLIGSINKVILKM